MADLLENFSPPGIFSPAGRAVAGDREVGGSPGGTAGGCNGVVVVSIVFLNRFLTIRC